MMLDAASMTFADGTTADFSGFYVIFTSNIASTELLDWQHSTFATMERHMLARAQQWLRPELYARIAERLVFQHLSYDVQVDIAKLMLEQQLEQLAGKGHVLNPDPEVLPLLVRRGFHPKLGARPLRDALERLIGDAVVKALLSDCSGTGTLGVAGEVLVLTPE